MRKPLTFAAAMLLSVVGAVFVATPPAQAAVGLRISGRNIVEANGNNFIMRGISHPHVWFPTQTSSFQNIKSVGANTVRVVLGSGQRWGPNSAADVANVISLCKAARLICVLEVHDTTGFGEEGAAATLDQAASYWISIASALMGQENYVVINIGNEPFGNNQTVSATWATATSNAINRLRNAGFDHLIMVDAPMWGQDWQNIMRQQASQVFNADPDRNTVFSIHMYEVYGTATAINSYFDAFQTAGLPLVVGEFGHMHNGQNVDEDTIMAQAQARGLGWIGWSWSGNSGGVEFLDMTNNFNVNSLTTWGQRIVSGANGLSTTSREATIYGTPCNDTAPPSVPGTPVVSNVTSSGATLTWTASTDSGCSGLAGYNVHREQGTTDPSLGTPTTNSITLTGLSSNTQYQVYVRARDNAGNLSGNSGLATFTTSGGGGPGTCSATPTTQSQWGNGYVLQPVTVTNTGTTTITSWTVTFTMPSGHTITGFWNATISPATGAVTARNMSYNGTLAPGQSTSFGFQASRPEGNTALPTMLTCTSP